MRVAVLGAAGRMGSTVCRAVAAAADMDLVAAVDPAGAGQLVVTEAPTPVAGNPSLVMADSLDALVEAGAQVAVDFTTAAAATAAARWCAAHHIHSVIGTTGLDEAALSVLGGAFPSTGEVGCVVAPNFAIGAVLMMRFAQMAAPWFPTAEIIELHHDAKVDAPSGTAILTANRMAAASAEWGADPTRVEVIEGARGGVGAAGIRVHSVRLEGLTAHQEVLLGGAGQTLTIRHDSFDRQSFMPGVLLAVRSVPSRPGVTVGLEALLGI